MIPQGQDATEEPRPSTLLADISAEMIAIYKDQFGRGPTRTRTEWAGPDTIIVVLEQTLTPVERTLVTMEEHRQLRDLRMLFQYSAEARFCEPVERLTGRKVKAFVSGVDTKADGLSTEVFVLHPPGLDVPSRAQL